MGLGEIPRMMDFRRSRNFRGLEGLVPEIKAPADVAGERLQELQNWLAGIRSMILGRVQATQGRNMGFTPPAQGFSSRFASQNRAPVPSGWGVDRRNVMEQGFRTVQASLKAPAAAFWADASRGLPEPGRMYAQVQTPVNFNDPTEAQRWFESQGRVHTWQDL